MAYPVETVVTEIGGDVATSLMVSLPEHVDGDVVFVCVAQDGVATLSGPGAPWVVVSAGNAGGAGRLVMYAVAGATPLPDPTVTSNISDNINAIAVTVRDADTSSVVDAWAYGSATSNSGISSPALTTTTADTLLLAFHVCDQQLYPRWPLDQLMVLGMSADTAVTNVVGYRVGGPAGAAPAVTGGVMTGVDAWQFVYVAVRNKAGGSLPPEIKSPPTLLAQYGYTDPVMFSLTDLTSTIDGSVVHDATTTTDVRPVSAWDSYLAIGGGASANMPGWYGARHTIDTTDFTDGLISLRFSWQVGSSAHGAKGWILIVVDAVYNWAAYQLLTRSQIKYQQEETLVLDFNSMTPIDSSVTPPYLGAITEIGYAYDRLNTTATNGRYTCISQLIHWRGDQTIFRGGKASPASPFAFAQLLQAGRLFDLANPQGGGQTLLRIPINVGDGSTATSSGSAPGASTEYRRPAATQKTSDLSLDITINASASDVVSFDFASIGSRSKQLFRIAPTSSPSATYSFTGTVFSGLEIEWKSGVPCDGANFFGCYQIDTEGAPFSNCSFSGSVATAGLVTSNPDNIQHCTFTQGSSGGHAIEITQPGTYSFVGNIFSGYGLDGTTDAEIYNNSGGHVVLNISGGGDTPTVRNGAGSTTDVVSGAQVSVVGLAAGSQVKVTKISNGDVLFNGPESGGQVSFSTTYIGAIRVDARKASASPYYKPWFSQANTVSGQTVEITALQELDE